MLNLRNYLWNNRKSSLTDFTRNRIYFIIYQGFPEHEEELRKMVALSEYEYLSIDEMWSLLIYLMEIDSKEMEEFLRQWKLPVKKIKEIKSGLIWLHYRIAFRMVNRNIILSRT